MPYSEAHGPRTLLAMTAFTTVGIGIGWMLFSPHASEPALPPVRDPLTLAQLREMWNASNAPRIAAAADAIEEQLGLVKDIVIESEKVAMLPHDERVPLEARLLFIEEFLGQMARAPADEEQVALLAEAGRNVRRQLLPFRMALEQLEKALLLPHDEEATLGVRYLRAKAWLHLQRCIAKRAAEPDKKP